MHAGRQARAVNAEVVSLVAGHSQGKVYSWQTRATGRGSASQCTQAGSTGGVSGSTHFLSVATHVAIRHCIKRRNKCWLHVLAARRANGNLAPRPNTTRREVDWERVGGNSRHMRFLRRLRKAAVSGVLCFVACTYMVAGVCMSVRV